MSFTSAWYCWCTTTAGCWARHPGCSASNRVANRHHRRRRSASTLREEGGERAHTSVRRAGCASLYTFFIRYCDSSKMLRRLSSSVSRTCTCTCTQRTLSQGFGGDGILSNLDVLNSHWKDRCVDDITGCTCLPVGGYTRSATSKEPAVAAA